MTRDRFKISLTPTHLHSPHRPIRRKSKKSSRTADPVSFCWGNDKWHSRSYQSPTPQPRVLRVPKIYQSDPSSRHVVCTYFSQVSSAPFSHVPYRWLPLFKFSLSSQFHFVLVSQFSHIYVRCCMS